MKKLGPTTQWFGGEEKPIHYGVYEVKHPHPELFGARRRHFACWQGYWGLFAPSPKGAGVFMPTTHNATQRLKWRGLVNKPEHTK